LKESSNNPSPVLSDLRKGEKAMIAGFNTEDIPAKFYSIGIIPGLIIEVYRIVPFNGPICIITGMEESKLAIRRSEAKLIKVERKK
jgi:ferrous iron transport protein A